MAGLRSRLRNSNSCAQPKWVKLIELIDEMKTYALRKDTEEAISYIRHMIASL